MISLQTIQKLAGHGGEAIYHHHHRLDEIQFRNFNTLLGSITPMDVETVHNHIKKGEWLVLIFFLLAGLVFSWFCFQIGFRLPSLVFGLPALFCFAASFIAYRRSMSWTHLSLHRDLLTIHFRGGRQLEFPIPASISRVDHTKGMRDFTLTLQNGSRRFYLITQRVVERELFDEWLGFHLKIGES